jgi:hypothetical protein
MVPSSCCNRLGLARMMPFNRPRRLAGVRRLAAAFAEPAACCGEAQAAFQKPHVCPFVLGFQCWITMHGARHVRCYENRAKTASEQYAFQ